MSPRLSDCLIALGNLRASAHACVGVLAADQDEELGRLRDRLSAELTASGPIRILGASAAQAERELASLCEVAADAARACRQRPCDDEGAMRVIRCFEAAVCIAQGVLRAESASMPTSGVHRASSTPPDPTRRTAS